MIKMIIILSYLILSISKFQSYHPWPTEWIHYISDYYDAVVVSGGFAIGHLKASCLQEILRMMKPGKFMCSPE
jgi:hypothetical protein